MDRIAVSRRIKTHALALGFDLVGICDPAPAPSRVAAFERWLDDGMAGAMDYMGRPDRVRRTAAPQRLTLPGARSMVVVGKNYFTADLPAALRDDPSRGLIASYAWGADYHDLLVPRLQELSGFVSAELGEVVGARSYVDTGPLLERDAAERAGLGFVGRNTMLIHPRWGAWMFLGELLVDVRLEHDEPEPAGTCGRCTRCLVACPTDAFPRPYVLDSRLCISYLTIELKGPIPPHLRPKLGNRIFGCDICNDVCPYNRSLARRRARPDLTPDPDRVAPRLLDLLALDDDGFLARYAGTPMTRPKRRGVLRNVCVALGNWGAPEAAAPLCTALSDHEPLIRGHAAWALGRIGGRRAADALRAAVAREDDEWVQSEIAAALAGASPRRTTARKISSSVAGESG